MSQNKTIIPGFDHTPSSAPARNDGMGGFYNRSQSAVDRTKTYIPDIYKSAVRELAEEQTPQMKAGLNIQGRTIVGVLFSISRFSTGELFPVYIGRNTIGSSEESDVCLPEETISPSHAVLLVRAIENADGGHILKIYLTDYDSEYGTMIGNVALEYEKMECHDHDIISVGLSYKFLLCLFDADKYKLFVDKGFKPILRQQAEEVKKQEPKGNVPIATAAKPKVSNTISGEDEAAFYGRSQEREGDHTTNKTVVF